VEAICRNVIHTDCIALDRQDNFYGEICCEKIGSIRFIEMNTQPQIFVREKKHSIQLNEEFIILTLQLSSNTKKELDSHQLDTCKNDILLLDGNIGKRLYANHNINALIVSIPKFLFNTHDIDIEKYHGTVLKQKSALSSLASNFIQTAARNVNKTIGNEKQIITSKLIDILVCALVSEKKYEHKDIVYQSQRERIKEYIANNCTSKRLTAEIIAKENSISIRYLHKIFEQDKYSVLQHINNARIKIAKELLKSPYCKLNLTGIAVASGFSCSASFSRKFREHCGLTPKEFKHEHFSIQ